MTRRRRARARRAERGGTTAGERPVYTAGAIRSVIAAVPGYPLVYAALFTAALVASLFFNGLRIEYFALSLSLLLVLWMTVLWRGYTGTVSIPLTAIVLWVTLYWGWLALTLIWGDVPYVNMANFWWLGSGSLVFWLMLLSPEPDRIWRWTSRSVLATAWILAAVALYQMHALGQDPRATFLTHNSHAALLGLVALPASAHYLLQHVRGWQARAIEVALLVFFLAIAATNSRGVILSLVLGLGLLAALAWRHVPRGRLYTLLALVAMAFVITDLLKGGAVVARLATVVDPASAGFDRYLIWSQAWRLLGDAPWFGIGLGTFWLRWPPYRDPADTTAGFYVHNDYLQIWIEAGVPGLLLLLGLYAAVVMACLRLWRRPGLDTSRRVESAGLFGGLLVIAVHTFFDFDLYIHPIQIVLGLVLARLHALYCAGVPVATLALRPAARWKPFTYRTLVLLPVLLPLIYALVLGISAALTNQGRTQAFQGKWVEASATLQRATRLMPTADMALILHADLLRRAALQVPPENAAERRVLYEQAHALLNDADKVNPLRPQLPFIRALLFQQQPGFAGPDANERAARAYAQALRLDPLAFWAREGYAQLLLAQGKVEQASRLLEDGVAYHYGGKPVHGYYRLTADLRRQRGDIQGADALERRIAALPGLPATAR